MTEGTPVRGTPFYSFPQETYVAPSPNFRFHVKNSEVYTPQQQTTSMHTTALSSQSSSSSSTAVGTPTHAHYAPIDAGIPSYPNQRPTPTTPANYQQNYPQKIHQPIEYPAGYTNGYKLGKSESLTSTASGSSSNGSRRRTKRGSNNTSGSSSGGSRPSSSSNDLMESLMSENESLRKQLMAVSAVIIVLNFIGVFGCEWNEFKET